MHPNYRHGIALPLTLLALSLMGLLVTMGFFLARLELRRSEQELAMLRSNAAAEAGIEQMLATWDGQRWDALPPGVTVPVASTIMGGGILHDDSLSRLGGPVFLLRSVGQAQDAAGLPVARAELGRWVAATAPAFPLDAAVAARGPLEVSGTTTVDGNDQVPAAWGSACPPPAPSAPAVRDSSAQVLGSGPCAGGQCLAGSPAWLPDSTLSDSALTDYGVWSFSALAAQAGVALSGTVSGVGPVLDSATGQCDPTVPTNWGEPLDSLSPCFGYLPIIRLAPGTRVDGGRGQGILLAEGDVDLDGGLEFYGVVVVGGRLSTSAAGARITGGLILRHPAQDTARIGGASQVLRSTCSAHRAGLAVPARPFRSRSWVRF
jgi:hypothetical protein